MRTPTVHLNGTSRETLRESYQEAYDAILNAREKLRAACPNARDYYVQGPEAFREAAEEHARRDRALFEVQQQIWALLDSVS